jgi:hypothetical protein
VGDLPTKEFTIPIEEGEPSYEESLHVEFSHEGSIVTRFCVSYVLTKDGVSYQPCRIDNAHGKPTHMDILNAAGEKIAVEDLGHIETRNIGVLPI